MVREHNWIDNIVSALEKLFKLFQLVLNAVYTVLENIIKALEGIIKRLVKIVEAILKISYYILPFVLMAIIGPVKNWTWMTVLGWLVLILVLVIFTRNFIALFRGISADTEAVEPKNLRRVAVIVGIANILMLTYSGFLFVADVSLEKELVRFLGKVEQNPTANSIREQTYLQIINSREEIQPVYYEQAVHELGRLKSVQAVQPLISKLLSFPVRYENLDASKHKLVIAIIDALSQIVSPDACQALVRVEVTSLDKLIKERASRAADKLCR